MATAATKKMSPPVTRRSVLRLYLVLVIYSIANASVEAAKDATGAKGCKLNIEYFSEATEHCEQCRSICIPMKDAECQASCPGYQPTPVAMTTTEAVLPQDGQQGLIIAIAIAAIVVCFICIVITVFVMVRRNPFEHRRHELPLLARLKRCITPRRLQPHPDHHGTLAAAAGDGGCHGDDIEMAPPAVGCPHILSPTPQLGNPLLAQTARNAQSRVVR